MIIKDSERRALASAAHILLRDETFQAAAKHVDQDLIKDILKGETPEARESRHHQYRGLKSVIKRLATLSGEWEQHLKSEQDKPND